MLNFIFEPCHILYHSDSDFNVAGFSNSEVDALLEEARVELDPGKRLALYQEVESRLLAEVAAVPLGHSVSDVLINPKVKGYVLSPIGVPIVPLLSLDNSASE